MTIKTDTATYLENPKVLQLPPAGGKYIDDLSQVEVLRFTDERDGNGGNFSDTYSVWPTLNCDNTRVWLFNFGGAYYVGNLNPTTFERVGPLEAVVPARGSFVDYETAFWSFTDPDKIFILVDCQIWSYKPSTKTYQTVADLRSNFPSGARFNQLYVSSDDNRFAAVVRSGSSGVGDYGIMVYERSSNSIKLNVSFDDINGITMGKEGKYVLLVRNDPEGQVKQRIYNVDTGAVELLLSDANGQPDYCIGHNDCGSDFIVAGDQWRGAFTARKLSTPHDVTTAWQYAKTGWIEWHISLRADNEAWALVSTFGSTHLVNSDGVLAPVADGPFVREVFQLGVKPPFIGQFRRLVHDRANWVHPNYWDTARATISRDGRFLCWTSNNNGPSGASRTDLFIAKIEPAPTESAPAPSPTPTPAPPAPPEPSPAPQPPSPPPPDSAPVVAITSPADGAKVSGEITVTANVTDTAKVTEVYLLVDSRVVGASFTAPYSFQLDTTKLTDGQQTLFIRAWNELGKSGDSKTITVEVANAPAPQPVPDPIPAPQPEPPKPTISAPASISIPRNSTGEISVTLKNLTEPTTVNVIGSDGQVTVSPLSKIALPTSSILAFKVKTKNKKLKRTITFQCSWGIAAVEVNVT